MKKYCPALLLGYALVFSVCPQAGAVIISCGQTVTGRIVSPDQKASYTFTTDAGDKIVTSTDAASRSLRADAEVCHLFPSNLLILSVLNQVASHGAYLREMSILNLIQTEATTTIDALDRDGNIEGSLSDSIVAERRVS